MKVKKEWMDHWDSPESRSPLRLRVDMGLDDTAD